MKAFIISDIHIPYQDDRAVGLMLGLQKKLKPDVVVIDGDLLDFSGLSKFSGKPLPIDETRNSILSSIKLIKKMQNVSEVIFIFGNHEYRFQRAIWDKLPEFDSLIDLKTVINKELTTEIKIIESITPESMYMFDDKILIGHFRLLSMHSAFTAKRCVDRYNTSIVQAHTHRLGAFYKRAMDTTIKGYECGCLCDPNPSYMNYPNWQQGFLVYTSTGAHWGMEVAEITDGAMMFRGERTIHNGDRLRTR
jgi:predicted MPP superfamily phosphohydrolase